MELHDSLRELATRLGPSVFDDPIGFRGALDDYVDEGAASTGDINILVDASRLGAFSSMTSMLDSGATPSSAIAEAGARLARDRGSDDEQRAMWACAALAYAVGRLSASELQQYQLPTTGGPSAPPPGLPPPHQAPTAGWSPAGPPQMSPGQPWSPQPAPSAGAGAPGQQWSGQQPGQAQPAGAWGSPTGPRRDGRGNQTKQTKVLLIVGGAVAALLLVVVPIALVIGSGPSESEKVAEEYLTAYLDGDFETVCDLSSEDRQDKFFEATYSESCSEVDESLNQTFEYTCNLEASEYYSDLEGTFEIEEVQEEDEDSTVSYTLESNYTGSEDDAVENCDLSQDADQDEDLEMVLEDEKWKVDEGAGDF